MIKTKGFLELGVMNFDYIMPNEEAKTLMKPVL
jgi:hypothetical protein